jgi:flagellar assembly factor FliW
MFVVIKGTRFGTVEADESAVIKFPNGLLGFPNERSFVLIEKGERGQLGYLQSVNTSWLAFPVMDAALLAPAYPEPGPNVIAAEAGLGTNDIAMLIIVIGRDDHLEANLLAPVVIDLESRNARQVVLDPQRYPSRLMLKTQPSNSATTSTAADANANANAG